jgi:hypothetical protein
VSNVGKFFKNESGQIGECIAEQHGWLTIRWRDYRTSQERRRDLMETEKPQSFGLAHAMNGVPDRPGYIYGLAHRDDKTGFVRVEVFRESDHKLVGKVAGIGWAGPAGMHAKAQRLVDAL